MTSRFVTGVGMLAAVAASVGGTAAAQRVRSMMQQVEQRRAQLPDNPRMSPVSTPGNYRFSFDHDGLRRDYLVHVPASYRGGPTPMLIALHGGGGGAEFEMDDSHYGLVSASERNGFILVAPNGFSRLRNGMLATWNAGTCCGAAQKNDVDDVGFIRAVIARMRRQANIDAKRIFATGMSNGGMMTWRLACEAPEIRAIAPVEGTDNTIDCRPSHPVAVIEFHALDDDHVPFNGGKGPKSIVDVAFTSVAASQAKWVAANGAGAAANRVLTVPGAYCDFHPGGSPVELCVTATGGHSWPGGGTQQGRKQPSQAISANDLMWRFFSSL